MITLTLQIFLGHLCCNSFFPQYLTDSITVSSNKNIQGAIFTSEIAILPDPSNFNSTVLLTRIVHMCLYAGYILAIMAMRALFRVRFVKKRYFCLYP